MDLVLPLICCFVVVGLRIFDGYRSNNDWPKQGELLLILTATWFLTYIANRFFNLVSKVVSLAWESETLYPIQGLDTLQLINQDGDQRVYVLGCVLITYGSVSTLVRLFPSTRDHFVPQEVSQVTELEKEVDEIRNELAESEKQVTRLTLANEDLEEQIERSANKAEKHRKERNTFRTIKQTAELLKKKVDDQEEDLRSRDSELLELKSANEELHGHLGNLAEQIENEKETGRRARSEAQKLQKQNNVLAQNIEQATEKRDQLLVKVSEISDETIELKDQLDQSLMEADQLRGLVQRIKKSESELAKVVEAVESSKRANLNGGFAMCVKDVLGFERGQ